MRVQLRLTKGIPLDAKRIGVAGWLDKARDALDHGHAAALGAYHLARCLDWSGIRCGQPQFVLYTAKLCRCVHREKLTLVNKEAERLLISYSCRARPAHHATWPILFQLGARFCLGRPVRPVLESTSPHGAEERTWRRFAKHATSRGSASAWRRRPGQKTPQDQPASRL